MEQFGSPEEIEGILMSFNSGAYSKVVWSGSLKGLTIEPHHHPGKLTIKNMSIRFPYYNVRLVYPLYVKDHEKLSGLSEKEQVRLMIDEKWKSEEDIIEEVVNYTLRTVVEIEQERNIKSTLSDYLKNEYSEFIK
jgi:hypothetical protein